MPDPGRRVPSRRDRHAHRYETASGSPTLCTWPLVRTEAEHCCLGLASGVQNRHFPCKTGEHQFGSARSFLPVIAMIDNTSTVRPARPFEAMNGGEPRDNAPDLKAYDGRRTDEAISWDAEAEAAVGAFIRRHLRERPAPPGSATAHDLEHWAERLEAHSRARRQAVAADRRLRIVA